MNSTESGGSSNAFDELTPYQQKKILNIPGKNYDTRSNLKKKPRHEKKIQLTPSQEVIVISSDSSCHNRYVSLLR